MNISMKNSFGEGVVVECQQLSNLPFNTTVSVPATGEAICCKGGRYFRLRSNNDYTINEKKVGLFGKKIDKDQYRVCFVDTNSLITGKFGGSVEVEDPQCTSVNTSIIARVQYNGKYNLKIEDSIAFVESGLLQGKDVFSQKDLLDKLRPMLNDIICTEICKTALACGFGKIGEHIDKMGLNVTDEINKRLEGKGIRIDNVHFAHCAPDEEHKDMKNVAGETIYAAKVAKEKDNILKGE